MKKVLFAVLAVCVCACAAVAEGMFVGGSVNYNQEYAGATSYTLMPEFGIVLDDKLEIGTRVLFGTAYDVDATTIGGTGLYDEAEFGIAPFARYSVAKFGKFNVKLQGTVSYTSTKAQQSDVKVWGNTFSVAVKPVVFYDISKSFSLFADLNFLNVAYVNNNADLATAKGNNGSSLTVGADADDAFNTNDFQVGFLYRF